MPATRFPDWVIRIAEPDFGGLTVHDTTCPNEVNFHLLTCLHVIQTPTAELCGANCHGTARVTTRPMFFCHACLEEHLEMYSYKLDVNCQKKHPQIYGIDSSIIMRKTRGVEALEATITQEKTRSLELAEKCFHSTRIPATTIYAEDVQHELELVRDEARHDAQHANAMEVDFNNMSLKDKVIESEGQRVHDSKDEAALRGSEEAADSMELD